MATSDLTPLSIKSALEGERLFITGATGFLGKVLVEKLLWSVPEVGKLLLLVRPQDELDAAQRVRREILGAPIMARLRALHGEDWESWAAGKVEAVPGDLGQDRFGLDEAAYRALCDRVDRVVANAATVTFDERLDRALELNARGVLRTLTLARDAGDVPLLHVSTCYVSGQRTGSMAERLSAAGENDELDADAVLGVLDEVAGQLRDGVEADRALVEAGAELARRHGFNDVYTLTKALGEGLLDRHRGAVPSAILRPAIVESAASEPIPGWIEDIRVADPLLVAYGRGRADELPGSPDVPMELVPVDVVVNAMLAALADLRRGQELPEIPVYQVSSSRHPITLGELMSFSREGFAKAPLRDEEGAPIAVDEPRFVDAAELRRKLEKTRQRVRALQSLPGQRRRQRLGGAERRIDHFLHLIDVYQPYLSHGATYEDAATRALWQRLSADEQAMFPFDIATLDWRSYIADVHVPGLARFALRAESGAPPVTPSTVRVDPGELAQRTHNLFDLFAEVARATPETMAFQTFRGGHWLRYTYGQALDATANLAHHLAERHGIDRGDRVALWASGSPEWVLTTFAVHRLGATIVPLDPQWPVGEIEAATRLVGAKLLCAAPRSRPLLGDPGCPVVTLAAPFVPEPDAGLLPGARHGASVAGEDDLASILFTSGSTLAPKAVPLTHGNYLANIRDLAPLIRLERERMLSVLPIHHIFEQMIGLLVPMAGAGTISYVAEIKPAEISWMMTTTQPTMLVAVPRVLELLHGGIMQTVQAGGPVLQTLFKVLFALSRLTGARHGHRLFGKVHRRFGGSLRRIASGGSPLRPSLGRSFELMGFKIAEGYGLTETSPVLTVNPWADLRFGSVGKPLPSVEIELRTPADGDADLAPGWGEVWARGPNIMAGYYENPQATAEVLQDGWFNTGDIGHFKDGYLYLSGRTKDIIVTDAGKNVYPEEVEVRYRGLPGVAELAILGLPSEAGGERVTAVIVPQSGSEEARQKIRATIAERSAEVPSYQQISRIEFWNGELPKTTTLKVKRSQLRDRLLAGQHGEAAKPAAPAAPAVEEKPRNAEERWVVDTLARLTRTRADLIQDGDRLLDLGVDSLTRVELIGALEARFDLRLDDATARDLDRVEDLLRLPSTEGVRA